MLYGRSVGWLLCVAISIPTVSCGSEQLSQQARSLLSNRCFACHGPDEEERQGGFRLDVSDSFLGEADSGIVPIQAGDPKSSELMRRVRSRDESEVMPPPEFGAPLSEEEAKVLEQWIESGAVLPQHWSFLPPQRPEIPKLADDSHAPWRFHPIDAFVRAKQIAHGLEPSAPASRGVLLRRLSLDLIGLPPTPEQVRDFEQNSSPIAYEEEVERLLASPRFGEHWARKWLDLARYADSAGYADDPPRTIWAYRDWVIRSLNDNPSVRDFTIDQLAGDLRDDPSQEHLVATAFHRNTLTNNEGGTNDEEFRNVAVVDRVNTTMSVWMGLTMACAQCHTHKYDPFTHEEYFQLFAILNQTEDADRRNESPTLDVFTESQRMRKRQVESRIEELEQLRNRVTKESREEYRHWTSSLSEPRWQTAVPDSTSVSSPLVVSKDGSIQFVSNTIPDTATFQVDLSLENLGEPIRALKLQALPSEQVSNRGPGLANGNFVLSDIEASVLDRNAGKVSGRYVRVEHLGKNKILSLAEVEVFSSGNNVAVRKKATQSTTDYSGPANLAVDGNTNGHFAEAKSTTHTRVSKDPWWELDLGATVEVDAIRIWNRTDNRLQDRLLGASVQILDEQRNIVFSTRIDQAKDHYQLALQNARPLAFAEALADYSQNGFEAEKSIDQDPASGWAIGGQQGRQHDLVLSFREPLQLKEGDQIRVTLRHASPHKKHLLGRFRFAFSSQEEALDWARLPESLRAIQKMSLATRTSDQDESLERFYTRQLGQTYRSIREELASLRLELERLRPATTVPILRELESSKQRSTFVQIRGNYKSLGKQVQPGTPKVFHSSSTNKLPNRMDLARWLVDERNPLTARVWVNRIWESLFGIGIVRSSEEFGSQGDRPSHPELLDWLAHEFMRSDWDQKAILRSIVTSQVYRQTSQVSDEGYAIDNDNIWLARGPRVRLSAEMVRDQSLFVAGLLSNKMFGAPVRPPQPDQGLKAAFGSATDWQASKGEDRFRRGLYTLWRRSNPYPSMTTFDAPSREVCTLRRDRTNTPLQALVTLNDPGFVEAAQALARRVVLLEYPSHSASKRLTRIFELATTRVPSVAELATMEELLHQAKEQLVASPEEAMRLATQPFGPLPDSADPVALAAYTAVCNVVLNLDEVLMKH